MATPTYDLLASTTLASSASSVTFSSIDQSYGDLVLVFDGTLTGNASINFQLNSDTGSNYNYVLMRGNGSSGDSSDSVNVAFGTFGYAVGQTLVKIELLDYTATDKHKSILSRLNNSTYTFAHANRWASTAAINRIDFILSGGESFAAASTFNLYGVAK